MRGARKPNHVITSTNGVAFLITAAVLYDAEKGRGRDLEEVGTGHHVIHGPHGHTHNNCIVITKLQNYSLQSQSYH